VSNIYVHMPPLSGFTGLILELRGETDDELLDVAGDALTETAAGSGRFVADVEEAVAATHRADIKNAAGQTVWFGWLAVGSDTVRDEYPIESSGLTEVQATQLDNIEAHTAQITGARLSVTGPVTPGGDITLIVGKDYVTAAENGLTRTITDAGGALHARLTDPALAAVKRFGASRPNGIAQITGTISDVTHASGITSISIEIERSAIPDSLVATADYIYQIERETSSGKICPEVQGNLTLNRRTV
jgi:hypothetical protein